MFDLSRLWGGRRGSKHQAKERLQLILVHDRSTLSPDTLEQIKRRILQVLAEFVEIDETNLAIELQQDDQSTALITSIPIKAFHRNSSQRGN
ncbi:MAG: cell division topological specificity factor MinE [Bacillota bacterium]|jgi:cell division topological specificity factor